MNKTISYCALIVCAGVVAVLAAAAPSVLSDDKNSFLKNFVNHELLGTLGVILAITLASIAQLHLAFNKIEEEFQRAGGLSRTRRSVHTAAYWLISLFVIAIALVVIKPIVAHEAWSQTIVNGAAILVLVWNVLILIDIMRTAFAIKPTIRKD